jgi:hypothetical protein
VSGPAGASRDHADNRRPEGAGSSAADASAALERRYRRLLAWYPADYRRTYGEEMLGVLLAAAPPDRARPGFAEAANLAWSGSRARIRHVGTSTDPRWRDALAVYSLVAPIVATVAIYGGPFFLASLVWQSPANAGPLALPYPRGLRFGGDPIVGWAIYVLTIAAPLIPVILALLRLRRTALVVCTWLLIWVAVDAGYGWQIQVPDTIAFIVLLATEVAALTMSAGPRRGLRLLTWKGALLASPWLTIAVVAALNERALSNAAGGLPGLAGDARYYLLLAIVATSATLVSAKTRRVVLLFAIPVAPFVTWYGSGYPKSTAGMFLVPALIALITFVISRRRRSDTADSGASPATPAQ